VLKAGLVTSIFYRTRCSRTFIAQSSTGVGPARAAERILMRLGPRQIRLTGLRCDLGGRRETMR
jgi:hypothetical protein